MIYNNGKDGEVQMLWVKGTHHHTAAEACFDLSAQVSNVAQLSST